MISAATLFVHSWTPITEGAQSLMNSIKYGLRRTPTPTREELHRILVAAVESQDPCSSAHRFLITSSSPRPLASTSTFDSSPREPTEFGALMLITVTHTPEFTVPNLVAASQDHLQLVGVLNSTPSVRVR